MTLDLKAIKQEITVFLRNKDILSTEQRNVVTDTFTEVLSDVGEVIINKPNIKNIRSIEIDDDMLKFGYDYLVDYDFKDDVTKCKITFTENQTGEINIVYDYGSDKIFPDYPKTELTINAFPRISVDISSTFSEINSLCRILRTNVDFSVIVYDSGIDKIHDYIKAIRDNIFDNWKEFYYLKGVIIPSSIGPILKSGFEKTKDKIFQQNADFTSIYNFEIRN